MGKIVSITGAHTVDVLDKIQQIDNILDDYVVCIVNGFNIDIDNGHVTYVDENWVFIGASVKADE